MNPGLIGGIVGSIVGVAGGLIGTYFSIKNTKGPQERAFVIKASIACWIFVLAFVSGMILIPGLYKLLLVPFYLVGLMAGILWGNRKQAWIRLEESQKNPVAPSTQIIPRKCPQCGKALSPDVPEGLCPACLLQRGLGTEGGVPPGTPPFTPPPLSDLARLFPQLEILELIGKGGMGAVYKARQPALDRLVALKVLAPRSGGDVDFAERFTREARALAKLSHPNIVGVYDFGQAGRLNYFIMEFVDGPNLRQVEQAGKLTPREALEIIPQICAALQFAHDEGIVHRDIKPENVLLDKKGRVKIADFGLAKILGQEPKDFRLTGVRDVVGTPHYMAPEQVEKPQTVDHRADIYSLGVVFYEMLTGELPLGKFQPPSSCARGMQIDVRLDEVVLHALEKEPARRYQQVSEVKTRVETIARTSRSSGHEFAPSSSQASQNRLTSAATASPLWRGVLAGLGVFLGAVILATGVTFLMPESYVGIARVELAGASPQNYDPYRVQTEFEVIESSVVLKPVADSMNLGERWRKIFSAAGRTQSDNEVVELMKRQLALQLVRNTSIIEVRFYSQSPKEAAEIANKISEVYCALPPGHRGVIIDQATVPLRPARPNRPLNLFIGVVAGVALGIFTGVTIGMLVFWRGRAARRAMSPPPVQKPDHFWRWFSVTVLGLIILVPVAILILSVLISIVAQKQIDKQESLAGQTAPPASAAVEPATNDVQTVAGVPPVVVETWPASGARDVEPGVAEIRVRFSKEMTDGNWSWSTAWENSTPETIGQIHYEADQRTCVLKAKLEPGRTYAWWLNSGKFHGFQDQAGRPAVPYLLIFQTKPGPALSPGDDSENTRTNLPRVISVSPADGATNVDLKQELRLRFDQPMNPNVMQIRWKTGGFVPDGQPRYEPDRNEFVIPARMIGLTNELLAQSSSRGFGGFQTANRTFAGDYRWHFTTRPPVAKPGAVKPNVIRISPAPGETLPVLTLLEITFDQPMRPPDQGFPYLRKSGSSFDLPELIPAFDYDPSARRYTVPVVLPPDNDTKLTLEGFYSADGVACDPVVIRCQIGTNNYSGQHLERIAAAAKDSRLEQLLSAMKVARARWNSGAEIVQETSFSVEKGAFDSIRASSATFKWQGTNQVYGDISEIMNMKAFILGTDGLTCWLYSEDKSDDRRLDRSPAALVPDLYTSVADPFHLTRRTAAEAIAKGRLVYQGQAQLDGRVCHRVQSWMVQQPRDGHGFVYAAKLEWWIDAGTLLPAQLIASSQFSSGTFRFRYEQLNQPLPDTAFQPPAGAERDAKTLFFKQAPAPDEKRFLTIKDGCDGEMSGRLGWSGPGGTTSSGLN